MPVAVRKTRPEDAQTLANIWLASLEQNEMVKLASPNGITAERLRGATRKVLADLDYPAALCLSAYDSDTDELMGCAVWRYWPQGKPNPHAVQSVTQEDARKQPDIAKDLDTASKAIFAKHVGNKPHAALDKLQTAPQHERRGVGSALIHHGLDCNRLPCYHFSTPQAVSLYIKHGFSILDNIKLDLNVYGGSSGATYCSPFMYRSPSGQDDRL